MLTEIGGGAFEGRCVGILVGGRVIVEHGGVHAALLGGLAPVAITHVPFVARTGERRSGVAARAIVVAIVCGLAALVNVGAAIGTGARVASVADAVGRVDVARGAQGTIVAVVARVTVSTGV